MQCALTNVCSGKAALLRPSPLRRHAFTQCQRPSAMSQRLKSSKRHALSVQGPNGEKHDFDQAVVNIGSSSTADLQIRGVNVFEEHAQLQQRSGRTFCAALVGDEEDLSCDTFTWLNNDQLRKGVSYLVAPNSTLAFGEPTNAYKVSFEEAGAGSTAAFETLMMGMAAGANEDVRKTVMDNLGR